MEAFHFERKSFQIEPFEAEKFSIRVTNVHKAINTELFLAFRFCFTSLRKLARQNELAVLFDLFVGQVTERIEEYSSGLFTPLLRRSQGATFLGRSPTVTAPRARSGDAVRFAPTGASGLESNMVKRLRQA
jgi:hypothetical protein